MSRLIAYIEYLLGYLTARSIERLDIASDLKISFFPLLSASACFLMSKEGPCGLIRSIDLRRCCCAACLVGRPSFVTIHLSPSRLLAPAIVHYAAGGDPGYSSRDSSDLVAIHLSLS